MKSAMAAAAALALAGSSAFAQSTVPTWPREWLGPWCLTEAFPAAASFERGGCKDLIIKSSGYDAPDASCMVLAGHYEHDHFNVLVACDGDPQHHFQHLRFSFHSRASKPRLLVDVLWNAPAIVEAGHDDWEDQ